MSNLPRLAILVAALACARLAAADTRSVDALDDSAGAAPVEVTGGALDARFHELSPAEYSARIARGVSFWLRVPVPTPASGRIPALAVHAGRFMTVEPYEQGAQVPLLPSFQLPEFGGTHESVFLLSVGSAPQAVYVRLHPARAGSEEPRVRISTLSDVLAAGAARARMIALAFGALVAMSAAGLLIWMVLSEKLFLIYAALFSLQALYVAYLSGQGFEWPVLSYATPLTSYAWNVPIAMSGAAACLFVRDIADLRRFFPRVYSVFGWVAGAFIVLTVANAAKLVGLGALVNGVGNTLFLATSIFTLTVSFMAWRRGSRAAGWFFIAWALLEAFTIATAIQLLLAGNSSESPLLYFGLPLSMVAAAVLIALGLADRLREQRAALSDAERRAQTDSLTGVLNRRSFIERLDAACLRAQARGLPLSLLFIDLDHFKTINDSFGHAAGDACLAAIIPPIQAELRQSDVIGRYGGEEFVVILSSADSAAAHPIAERILSRVAAVRVDGFGEPIQLTCSIGVATTDRLGVWGEHLIAKADAAVYAAKRSGRNRVEIAESLAA